VRGKLLRSESMPAVIGSSPEKSREPRRGNRFGWALTGSGIAPLCWVLVLYVLLRVPSWFEPHWYTDEGGYATTAWLSTHGKELYVTVWNNKPPLLFWIYDLALRLFGTSELGIHLLSTVAGGIALAALWKLLGLECHGRRLWLPLVGAAFLLGTPICNGDLALPENFLIAPEAWAMFFLVLSLVSPGWKGRWLLPAGSGILFGLACLIQQTALAPAAAGAVLLLVLRGRRGMSQAFFLVVGLGVTGVAGVAPYLISAGFHNVFHFLVQSIGSYTTSSLPVDPGTLVPRGLALALLLAGIVSSRGYEPLRRVGLVWLAADLIDYVLPNRDYAHFLLPSVVPACLLLGLAVWPGWTWLRGHFRQLPLLAAVVLATVLWVQLFASQIEYGSLYTAQREAEYVPLFISYAAGRISPDAYVSDYNTEALGESLAVQWIDRHHLRGATAVVWSADSWAYILADLKPVVPAPPIYVDSDWLGTTELFKRIRAARPELILLTPDAVTAFGPIQAVLDRDYRRVERSAHGSVWLLDSAVAEVEGRHQ
jgi:hypothetical protein